MLADVGLTGLGIESQVAVRGIGLQRPGVIADYTETAVPGREGVEAQTGQRSRDEGGIDVMQAERLEPGAEPVTSGR